MTTSWIVLRRLTEAFAHTPLGITLVVGLLIMIVLRVARGERI